MVFNVRTHFSISHDDRENERITDPNSIYFYSDDIPKELHMRYVRDSIMYRGLGWSRELSAFICEETMVLKGPNDTIKIEGSLIFVPSIRPTSILDRITERLSGIADYVVGRLQ